MPVSGEELANQIFQTAKRINQVQQAAKEAAAQLPSTGKQETVNAGNQNPAIKRMQAFVYRYTDWADKYRK